ncbi:uncharacterized protein ATNIH1004_007836 [Aspergillus tanneri]|uniref:Uncharacterized protein n=1 Tax=Aspergillus tanneri TaxID=1220188 RepID=A0A5M9MKH7_9EURO|nr:uncharacterized protein ATNIH1004_007836 [Aspergillus tanneri]KAA8646406.1 hypothetical protein ATNIH1004_007836 [Aspergillus tanneri]
MSNFQLFPPPSPKPKVSKNPFRRELKRPSDPQPTSPIPLEDLKNKDTTEAVLLQIIEDTNNIKMPPKARRPKTSVSAPKSNWEPRSTVSSSKSGPQNDKSGQRDLSKGDESASGSNVAPQHSASPEIPMRSICPRYNPNVPLGEQGYYPETGHASRHKPRDLKLSPPPEIDRALGPKTVPASVVDFPLDISDATEIHYASATELQGLWEAANGQKTQDLSGMFNLRIARTESATFVFGDPRAPFYTMQTYSTDEMSISRTNPSNTKSNVPIMMLRLEDRCRREPPNDGLVSLLFSRLAAMLAIEQAEELARQHQLSPGEAAEVEGNALRRAAAQESCRLTWNRTKKLYELHHPWLEKQQPPALVGAMGIPLSPIRSKYSGGPFTSACQLHPRIRGNANRLQSS